jgi:hypothetical protein
MKSLKELYEKRKRLAEFQALAGISEEYSSALFIGICGNWQNAAIKYTSAETL